MPAKKKKLPARAVLTPDMVGEMLTVNYHTALRALATFVASRTYPALGPDNEKWCQVRDEFEDRHDATARMEREHDRAVTAMVRHAVKARKA